MGFAVLRQAFFCSWELVLEKTQTSARPQRLIKHQPRNVLYKKQDLIKVANAPGGMKRFKLKGKKADG